MCGIVGYIGKKKNALNVLIDGLKHLEYRGYDSAGICYLLNGEVVIKKAVGRITNLEEKINFDDESYIGIGHTRWATHGCPSINNSHPHQSGDIIIVHNGIIENYLELKKELIKKGFTFNSETDTEVACSLLDSLYQKHGNMNDAIIEFKKTVIGSYAIAMICAKEPTKIYVIKKGSPLIIGVGKEENYLASDMPALMAYTNKYIVLEDESFAILTNGKVMVYDANNRKIANKIKTYAGSLEEANKGHYGHYMLKEIHEESNVIRKLSTNKNLFDISKYQKIVIVACGSAMHAGLVGARLIETYAGIPVTVEIASEFRYKKLFLDKHTLVIAISQSGETADTLEAVKIAKEAGTYTLGIINVVDSSIARLCDNVIYTDAGVEVAVATTKAYLGQVAVLSMLSHAAYNGSELAFIDTFNDDFKRLPSVIESLTSREKEYQKIAKKIYKARDIFYIGRGIDYALAMEASLKIKEISYIHSEAYAAGELKHGTISLIENGTPVIGIVTDPLIASKTISNLKEVKSRGAYVIYVTTEKLFKKGDFYDGVILLPDVNPLLQPIVNVIPMQLVAYYVAKLNKCDIDKPKNLAKSVTVE